MMTAVNDIVTNKAAVVMMGPVRWIEYLIASKCELPFSEYSIVRDKTNMSKSNAKPDDSDAGDDENCPGDFLQLPKQAPVGCEFLLEQQPQHCAIVARTENAVHIGIRIERKARPTKRATTTVPRCSEDRR